MVGKELIDLRDADGKAFVKERVELAPSKERFWHNYKFTDPVTKRVLGKSTYCERVESTASVRGNLQAVAGDSPRCGRTGIGDRS
jgi:cytochrome c